MKKITILFFYLILIIYSLEILTKIFIPEDKDLISNNMDQLKIDQINKIKNFDKRNDYEAFKEEKEKTDIYPAFRLSIDTINSNREISKFFKSNIEKNKKIPFRGPINKLSLGNNEEGKRELVINDKYGFKNLNKVYDNKIDIMIIGDSFAEGIPFGNENNVSALINKNSKYNSINYGVSGSGPLNSLGIITEYGKYFKPKKVFYFFYEGNDLRDLLIEKDSFLINYLDRSYSQNLFSSNKEINYFLNDYENLFFDILPSKIEEEKTRSSGKIIYNKNSLSEHIKDILEIQNLKRVVIPKDAFYYKNEKLNYSMLEKSLIEMKNRANSWNGDFYLVFLPSWTRYNNSFSFSDKYIKKEIETIVNNNNINFIDMDDIFRKNKMNNINLFNLGIYGHYTKEGYKILAKTIITKL